MMRCSLKIESKEIKLVNIYEIVKNPKNVNKHSEEQLERLEKIIQHNGFRVPLIISNRSGLLISGHARLEVAERLKMQQVPCVFQDFKNEAEELQFLTADNEISRWAELDVEKLNLELKSIDLDFDLDLLGIKNFSMDSFDLTDTFDEAPSDSTKQFKLEIIFPNEMEMQDVHDDLLARGYLVKIR